MSVTLSSCDLFLSPIDQDPVDYVRTTITGRVTDEAGKSVQGALVKGHGASTTTNSNGVFVLRDVAVPSTRAVITVSKGGYFTGARAAYPSASKTTTMLLTLQESKVTRILNAATGGLVTVGAASVELPANGFVDEQGNAYTGTVSVAVRYLDPASDDFYSSFSGDMAAARADGSATELISYGVLRVKLTGSQGQELNLRKGSAATLTYPAAGATDASIPLWFFDETEGIWVEEGTAVRSGNNYVGTVQHFTDWNLDKPTARSAYIEGRVTCGANVPLAGIVVDIGQVSVVTDQDGMYKRRVPADIAFDVVVKGSRNEGISSSSVTVGPIAQDQTLKHDIAVAPCPTLLEAQIVDCDNNPVGGFLQVITPSSVKIASSTTGRVLVTVPAGVALTIEGYSTEGRIIPSTPIAPITAGLQFNAGNLQACSGVATDYLDIMLPDGEAPRYVAMNLDGSRAAVVTQSNVHMYDATTGTLLWKVATQGTTSYPTGLTFVAGDKRLALLTYKGTTVFDAVTGQNIAQVVASGRQFITANGASVYTLLDSTPNGDLAEYDAMTGVQRRVLSLGLSSQKGNFLGLQGNDRAIIQSYTPSAILTIDLASGSVLRTYKGEGDTAGVSEASSLSPSGNVAMLYARSSGTSGGQLTAVDLVSGKVISRIQTSTSILAISSDDEQYVSRAYTSGAATTLSTLRTQQLLRVLPWSAASQSDYISGCAFSGDGSRLVGISANGANNPGSGVGKVRVFKLR
jgi:WD40 repeat protein